jgi:hypothetical protein
MAISTNALIDFFGTQDSIDDGSTSSVANNALSVAADITSWTNDDDAPYAVFVMRCQFATAPTDGSLINIYGRKMNVQSTSDSPTPTAVNTDQYIGSFIVDGDIATATDAFLVTNWLALPNYYTSQVYDFYFENKTGQTITAGWAAWITPVTKGPHA